MIKAYPNFTERGVRMKKVFCLLLMLVLILCAATPAFAADESIIRFGNDLQELINEASPGDELHVKVDSTKANDNTFEVLNTITIDKPLKIYFEYASYWTALADHSWKWLFVPFECETGRIFLVTADNVELHFGERITLTGQQNNTMYGEAIYVEGNNCLIDGGIIDHCGRRCWCGGSDYDGGAIYVDGEGCTIQNVDFQYCTGYDGGAICVNKHNCHIINCTFEGCEAVDDGGAVYVCYGKYGFVASGCTFNDCVCYDEDSGNYIEGARDAKVYNCNPHWGEERYYAYCEFATSDPLGFTLSSGNWWIIGIGAVVILGGIAAILVVNKKKKTAA